MARLAALLLAALYLPPLLIFLGIIPFAYRYAVLLIVAAALALVALYRGTPARKLGLSSAGLKPSLAVNAALSLVVGAALLAAFWLGLMPPPRTVDWWWFAPFYVLVSCLAQEFICRGFLFAEMERRGVTGAWLQILISAVSYAFLHIVYRSWPALLATLCIGLVWGAIYRSYPNLWGVVLSHVVLGLIAIAVGLV
jgi:membrane protease YdiL (CAAX protease family)